MRGMVTQEMKTERGQAARTGLGCLSSGTDSHPERDQAARTGLIYLFIAIFCALFGAVYEVFSHGVFSFYMIYAFVLPLMGGALPYLVMSLGRIRYPRGLSRWLGHAGIAALTVGCVMKGVLEIYGTTNALVWGYFLVGIPMLVAAGRR